jgi:hypothetical protein
VLEDGTKPSLEFGPRRKLAGLHLAQKLAILECTRSTAC